MTPDLYEQQLNKLHQQWHEAASKGDDEAAINLEKRINIVEKIYERFKHERETCCH